MSKEFEFEGDYSWIEFSDGSISFSNYSYYIDSWGGKELDFKQTKELYLAMKEYYEHTDV